MRFSLHTRIEKTILFPSRDRFAIPILFGVLVFLLLIMFQPFEYRSYTLLRVLSDSLLSAILVLIITFTTRTIIPYLVYHRLKKNESTLYIYVFSIILDIVIFLILTFLINLFSGNFKNISYIKWFELSLKYILIFEVLFIPLSLFLRHYFSLYSFFKNEDFFFSSNQKSEEFSQPLISKILFTSDTEKQQLEILPQDLLMIKSCSNYIEVSYVEDEKIRFCLLRNTFANINDKIKEHPFLFKCHRSYLININKVVKVKGNSRGYKITIDGLSCKVPVSRSKIPLFNSIFYVDKN